MATKSAPKPATKKAKNYKHPESESPMRPEVGTQAQFKKKLPAKKYRYDDSLSPALEWDGQSLARERGEARIAKAEAELAEARKKLNGKPETKDAAGHVIAAQEAVSDLKAMSKPFLNWAGKAERLSFDVPTLPLFIHERLSTKAILETLKGHKRDKQTDMFDLFGDPQHSIADQVLRAYEHKDKWVNRMILGDSLIVMNSLLHYEGLSRQAAEVARRNDQKETAAVWLLNAALRDAEVGNIAQARQQATSAQVLASTRDLQILVALTLARSGDTVRAQTMADDLNKHSPLNTMLNGYWLPTIRAAIALDGRHPDKAAELLQSASAYELGEPPPAAQVGGTLYPVYVRGEAYLKAGQGQQAAAEFQKLIDHRGIVQNFVLGALAHLQLGRARALSGDKESARKGYQDFLALWKDADPDIPILKEAKAEYAKLQ
jgi:tetratricopeptide (TPR) repeat protein